VKYFESLSIQSLKKIIMILLKEELGARKPFAVKVVYFERVSTNVFCCRKLTTLVPYAN